MKRDWLTLAFGIALVGAVVGLSLRQNMTRGPAETVPPPSGPAVATTPASSPASTPAAPEPGRPPSGPAGAASTPSAAVRNRPEGAAGAATTPPAGTDVNLQVQSDVPGASVFLDREFVGTTPLTLRGLTAGSRQLNVTATGHDGFSETIELAPGANRVNVEFLKVRLNATVPVLHRHAMGFCQGMLVAGTKGISYDTTNKVDAFSLPFAELDEFEVDYLKKNLRLRRRAGKTWNFTNENADALFVFHRDVTKAREKLGTAR